MADGSGVLEAVGGTPLAVLQVAERLGPGRTAATPVFDSGIRYLSTEPYASAVRPSDPVMG